MDPIFTSLGNCWSTSAASVDGNKSARVIRSRPSSSGSSRRALVKVELLNTLAGKCF